MEQSFSSAHAVPTGAGVMHIGVTRPFHWLALGWEDLFRNPFPSISYGLILAAMGWLIIIICSTQIELLALAVSGFLLVGPIFSAGFYALSRLRANGQKADFDASLDAAVKNIGSLARLGVVLAIIAIAWAIASGWLFQKEFGEQLPEVEISFYRTMFEWSNPGFLLVYLATGAILAVLAFMASAVSAPMIFDRGGSTWAAILTSIKAVALNLIPMALWAALIAALTLFGFATFMAGLIIVLPLIGHATWHAYKDLVA
jgi:uncharacterized membrane protein